MAYTNYERKAIHSKVVFFGPVGAGKMTNLRVLCQHTLPALRDGSLVFAETETRATDFAFVPIGAGTVNGFDLRLHLFRYPDSPEFVTSSMILLNGIDGVIFVADSRLESMADNIEALAGARRALHEAGIDPDSLFWVFQYNRRDEPGALDLVIMSSALNPQGHLEKEAIATRSVGVLETVQAVTEAIVDRITREASLAVS